LISSMAVRRYGIIAGRKYENWHDRAQEGGCNG
jgi:hypothetical protein